VYVSTEQRAFQVFYELEANFVTPYPTVLRWVRHVRKGHEDICSKRERAMGDFAITYYENRKCRIDLSRRLLRRSKTAMLETLMHEYAHALTMVNGRIYDRVLDLPEHPDEWALAYGRIYRYLIDDGGLARSTQRDE